MALEELSTSENRRRTLRQEIKAVVAALDKEYTREANLQMFRRVTDLPEYEQADTLFCFVGTSSEIGATPILEDALRRGKRIGVPRCISRRIMEIHEIRSFWDSETEKYGIVEPGAYAPVIRAGEINLAIVPCMSCSHNSGRLGYDGRYHDRYLDRAQAMKAVIYKKRTIHVDISVKPRDQMMDMVMPEKGVRRLVGQ